MITDLSSKTTPQEDLLLEQGAQLKRTTSSKGMKPTRSQTLRTIIHVKKGVPKFVTKVGKSIIPVTIYNVGIDHHQLSVQEISKNILDASSVELITRCIKMAYQIHVLFPAV